MDVMVLPPLLEDLALLGDGSVEPAARHGLRLRQDAVGDQQVGAQAAQGEGEGGGAHGVGAGRAGFGHQPYDGVAVVDHGLHGGELDVPAGRGLVQPLRGHRNSGQPPQDGPQRAGGLPFGGDQPAQVAAQLLGEREQGEGLRGGGQIHDEQVVPLAEGGVPQRPQQRELLGTGEGVTSSGSSREAPRRSRAAEARSWKPARSSRKLSAASGRQAVRVSLTRVGVAPVGTPRAAPRVSVRSPPSRRVRVPSRAAASAVAAATVVRPLPPGPVIRMVRMGVNRNGRRDQGRSERSPGLTTPTTHVTPVQAFQPVRRSSTGAGAAGADPYLPDSTRFFSPANARSMMTFSAFRLIIPSIGILTSTVSW